MPSALWILAAVFGLACVVVAYACCVAAGRADDAMRIRMLADDRIDEPAPKVLHDGEQE